MDVLLSLPKVSGMVRLLVPVAVSALGYSNRAVLGTRYFTAGVPNSPKYLVWVWMSYRIYQSKVPGTGIEGVPSLPKCWLRVIQGVCTPCTL